MRAWDVPTRAVLESRIAELEADPFYDFDAGVVVDDIYLSRAVVGEHGPGAIAETEDGADLLARAPVREHMHHALFSGALVVCRAAYAAERAWARRVRRAPREAWPAIEETKAW